MRTVFGKASKDSGLINSFCQINLTNAVLMILRWWVLGMGHWALGMGHWAWGIGGFSYAREISPLKGVG